MSLQFVKVINNKIKMVESDLVNNYWDRGTRRRLQDINRCPLMKKLFAEEFAINAQMKRVKSEQRGASYVQSQDPAASLPSGQATLTTNDGFTNLRTQEVPIEEESSIHSS